jgi:hypothetical protein
VLYALARGSLPRARLLAQVGVIVTTFAVVGFPFFALACTNFRQCYEREINGTVRAHGGPPITARVESNLRDLDAIVFSRRPMGDFLSYGTPGYLGPLRQPVVLALFFFGLGVLLGRFWEPIPFFALLALSLGLLPALASELFPRRILFVAPILSVVAVAGIAALTKSWRKIFPSHTGARAGAAALMALTVMIAAQDLLKFRAEALTNTGSGITHRALAEYIASLDERTEVYLDAEYGEFDTIFFLLYARFGGNWHILHRFHDSRAGRPSRFHVTDYEHDGIPEPQWRDRPALYLIYRRNQAYDRIRERFRERFTDRMASVQKLELTVPPPEPSPIFYICVVSPTPEGARRVQ